MILRPGLPEIEQFMHGFGTKREWRDLTWLKSGENR